MPRANRAGSKETLQQIVDEVAKSLATTLHALDVSIIRTPLLYPGSGTVLVHIHPTFGGFHVSDMGDAYAEADMIGATSIYSRNAPAIAKRSGVSFEAHAFSVPNATREQLVGAVMTIANCAKEALEITTLRLADKRTADASDLLHARLLRIFDPRFVTKNAEIIGSSNRRWNVAAQVRMDDHETVFEPVSSHHSSIYSVVAEFHDLARLEHPPSRVAVVHTKKSFGNDLNLLSQAGMVVEESISDQALQRLALAA